MRIKDAALVAAAMLSNRYITDRFLPDKAIDLVDEAAAKLRTEIDSMPAELDEVKRRVMQLEIERDGPEEGEGPRLARAPGQAREGAGRPQRRRRDAPRPSGRPRRTPCSACATCARQIEQTKQRHRAGQARLRPEQGRRAASTARSSASKSKLKDEEEKLAQKQGQSHLLKEEVDEEDIAEVVSRWTGIPVSQAAAKARCRSCCTWKRSCTSA